MVLFILAYVGIFLDFLVFEEQFKLLRQCFFFLEQVYNYF